jgi:hypothetical protein
LINVNTYLTNSANIAHNAKVVNDGFGVAIEELRSSSSNPKNVAGFSITVHLTGTGSKGEARLGFYGTQTAEQAVCAYNPVRRRILILNIIKIIKFRII